MIGIVSGPSAAGGGGSVTSVATSSNSLADASAPNPIVGVGTVSFEIQIISSPLATLQADELAGRLLPGVTYEVKNWNKPIGNGRVLIGAQFKAVFDASVGGVVLSKRGSAYSAAHNYDVVFDLQNNLIKELYLPVYNQRASRTDNFFSNNIESLPWEDSNSVNFRDVLCNYSQLPVAGTNRIENSELLYSSIDWGNSAVPFISGTRVTRATVALLNAPTPGNLTDCTVKPGCNITIQGPTLNTTFEESCTGSTGNSVTVRNAHFEQGSAFLISSGIANTNDITYNAATTNDIQLIVPVNGATDVVADSYKSIINVNLDPAGVIPAYTLQLPANPRDKQTVNIASTQTITALTINTIGPPVIGVPTTLAGLTGHIRYIWDDGAGTWYLV